MTDEGQSEVTVAELTAHGVETVEASCLRCGQGWWPPITFLPATTTIRKIAALMVCPTCAGRDVEIQVPVQAASRLLQ